MKFFYHCPLPIQTVSESNSREHWATKYARAKKQKRVVHWLFNPPPLPPKCTIRLTRVAKRRMDGDNLQASLKYVRDAVAEKLRPGLAPGRADGELDLVWEYAQASPLKSEYAVIVEVSV